MPPTRNRGRNNGRNSGRRNLGRPNDGQQQQQLQPSLRLCHPDRNRYRPFDQGPSYGTSPGSQRQVHPRRATSDDRPIQDEATKAAAKAAMANADVQRSVRQSPLNVAHLSNNPRPACPTADDASARSHRRL
jgi:hypothetical protein